MMMTTLTRPSHLADGYYWVSNDVPKTKASGLSAPPVVFILEKRGCYWSECGSEDDWADPLPFRVLGPVLPPIDRVPATLQDIKNRDPRNLVGRILGPRYRVEGFGAESWDWRNVVAGGPEELATFDTAREADKAIADLVSVCGFERDALRVVEVSR